MADDTPTRGEAATPPATRQPSWAWVLLLGIPGALIASAIATRRNTTVKRGTWPVAVTLFIVGLAISVAVPVVLLRAATPAYFGDLSSLAGGSSGAASGGIPTAAPAGPPTTFSFTDTATWTGDGGYKFAATVSLGHLAPFQPGMTLSASGVRGPLTAGSACSLVPGVDAVIPGRVIATNNTAGFSADVRYHLAYVQEEENSAGQWHWSSVSGDVPWTEVAYSSGPSCVSPSSSAWDAGNVTCPQVPSDEGCATLFYVIIKNYFRPNQPGGDLTKLSALGLTLFTGPLSGPDAACYGPTDCAIRLRPMAL